MAMADPDDCAIVGTDTAAVDSGTDIGGGFDVGYCDVAMVGKGGCLEVVMLWIVIGR